jgi:hypothetical protein
MIDKNSVKITGGNFTGVTAVGQGNKIRVDSVNINNAPTELSGLFDTLVAKLAEVRETDADYAIAHDRAVELKEELAEPEPDSGRVARLWQRLRGLLDVAKFGVEIGKLVEAISTLVA